MQEMSKESVEEKIEAMEKEEVLMEKLDTEENEEMEVKVWGGGD